MKEMIDYNYLEIRLKGFDGKSESFFDFRLLLLYGPAF